MGVDLPQGYGFEPSVLTHVFSAPAADNVGALLISGLDGHVWAASLEADDIPHNEWHEQEPFSVPISAWFWQDSHSVILYMVRASPECLDP